MVQGSGHVLDPSPDSCRVLGSSPGMGQISRVTLRSESINQACFNEFILHESTGLKAQVELLETGPSQVLFPKPVEISKRLEPIPRSSEAGQEGIVSSHEEEDEHIEDAARAEGHKLKKRYAENFFDQSISTPFSVFGRPLLLGDSSGLGDPLQEKALPLRIVGADGKEWSSESTSGISDEGEETDAVGQRKEAQSESFENWNNGSWESSCLVKFSEFLGFPTKGFEKEILNLLRNLVASQKMSKGKGSQTVSKSERELRRLRSTINYNGNKFNKGGGRDRGNLLLKLK